MFVIDRLLRNGLVFVLDKVARAVDAELESEQGLQENLLAAQMRLELGEIDEDEFVAIEREIIDRLRELRSNRQGGEHALGSEEISGVEVSAAGDES